MPEDCGTNASQGMTHSDAYDRLSGSPLHNGLLALQDLCKDARKWLDVLRRALPQPVCPGSLCNMAALTLLQQCCTEPQLPLQCASSHVQAGKRTVHHPLDSSSLARIFLKTIHSRHVALKWRSSTSEHPLRLCSQLLAIHGPLVLVIIRRCSTVVSAVLVTSCRWGGPSQLSKTLHCPGTCACHYARAEPVTVRQGSACGA